MEDLKTEFRNWMEGNMDYSGQTPGKYTSALNTVVRKTPELHSNKSLFDYSKDEIKQMIPIILKSIESNPKNTVNDHNTSICAIRQLLIFLDEYYK